METIDLKDSGSLTKNADFVVIQEEEEKEMKKPEPPKKKVKYFIFIRKYQTRHYLVDIHAV